MPHILNAKYHDILISDHSPVTFILNLTDFSSTKPIWRVDPQLLSDPCVDGIRKGAEHP